MITYEEAVEIDKQLVAEDPSLKHMPFFDIDEFVKGLNEEMEHFDSVGGDMLVIGKLVMDHIKEKPYYYTSMEKKRAIWNRKSRTTFKTPTKFKRPPPVRMIDHNPDEDRTNYNVKCSYCGTFYKYKEGIPEGMVSHGICPECEPMARMEVEEYKRKMRGNPDMGSLKKISFVRTPEGEAYEPGTPSVTESITVGEGSEQKTIPVKVKVVKRGKTVALFFSEPEAKNNNRTVAEVIHDGLIKFWEQPTLDGGWINVENIKKVDARAAISYLEYADWIRQTLPEGINRQGNYIFAGKERLKDSPLHARDFESRRHLRSTVFRGSKFEEKKKYPLSPEGQPLAIKCRYCRTLLEAAEDLDIKVCKYCREDWDKLSEAEKKRLIKLDEYEKMHPNPSDIQSIKFERKSWTVARAKAWAKKHGLRYGDVLHDSRFIVLRQHEPDKSSRYAMKKLGKKKGLYALFRFYGPARKNPIEEFDPCKDEELLKLSKRIDQIKKSLGTIRNALSQTLIPEMEQSLNNQRNLLFKEFGEVTRRFSRRCDELEIGRCAGTRMNPRHIESTQQVE